MAQINQVEFNIQPAFDYFYCDDCLSQIPDWLIKDSQIVEGLVDGIPGCENCGKEWSNADAED